MCSLSPPACCGCAAMWIGVATGADGDVCWQLRFTKPALALKVEGRSVVSGKLSSLRSHTTDPRVASGSRLGVERAAAYGASSSLCPHKGTQWESGACSKGSSS